MKPRLIFQYIDGTSDKIVVNHRALLPIIAKALLRNLNLHYVLVMEGGKEGGSYKCDTEKTLAEPNEKKVIAIDGRTHDFSEAQ